MIVFDPSQHSPERAQGMLSQVVAPRPIAMISTARADGLVNVAPFSYFMAVTGRPLLVAVSMGLRASDARDKDTYLNAMRAGDFVINVTADSMREDVELAAMEFPADASELEAVDWKPIRSHRVSSPSLAESPVHLECRVHCVVELGEPGILCSQVHLVIGEVACIVLDESVCTEDFNVDQRRLAPVGRMGFPWFTRSTPESMFQLTRVPYEEFVATGRRSRSVE
ncbi:MAG: flavin reductase family protein [Steroidobacteraceae bacterium]